MARITQDDDSDDSSSSTTIGSCLMARETKVMEPPPSLSSVLDNEAENQDELTVLKELYNVRCTLRGEALVKFDFLMDSLKEKDESIEELEYHLNDKERRFNLLRQELKTERCISQGLKQQIETYELDKVKDLETIERAQLLTQELNASKEELEVAHASLTRDLDHLERANKLVKDELKKLGKNHDLLQESYSKALESMNDSIVDKNVASSSTTFTSEHAKLVAEHVRLQEELSLHVETNTYLESLVTKYGLNYYPNESACEQATTLEENVRLKKELAKFTTTKSKMGLDDLLSKQRSNNQKYGLGYTPKPYKKNNYKKEKPAQEKNKKEFITFAKKAQRTYESEIKAIRTDNGTEFKNYTMQEFVDDEGIKHEFSAPYTPQQNGVVERKNRTIIEMARTMLSEFNSPHNFWGEAISTVHYSNRLFLRPPHNKTPYELLTGNKPNVTYIRVFGCKCLVKNNKGKLGKFETRTIEGIFVGYAENSHAYRYYNRSTGTIEVSCDVVFLEDNGSQVEQVVPCVAGNDDDPSSAIKHMGIGHIRPMEVHNDDQDDGVEVSSSPQVEPSSTQVEPSSATQDVSSTQDEPHPEEQEESPQPTEQDHDDDQETSSTHVQAQVVPHDQVLARDEFIDHEGTIRKIKAATRASDMKVDLVLGSISKGVVHEALVDPDWVIAMQEELECFTRNEVWSLVERPKDHRINVIGTKWVFKNKQDEDGIVIRNKARKFEMSMMGELKFFLGFQVRQLAKGTFISQEKYVKDMLKKFNMTNASPMKTPMPVKGQLGSCDDDEWTAEDRGTVAKRGRHSDVPPRRSTSRAPQTTGGSSAGGHTKKPAQKRKDKHAAQEDDEELPEYNIGDVHIGAWKRLRETNHYRFEAPTYTGGDKFFWTQSQQRMWLEYYDSREHMKNGTIVMPKAVKDVIEMHAATTYRFVVETLKNMGLYELVCLTPSDGCYCPLLVRQFHCTVYFHDDPARTMTWMTGKEKYSCNYLDFCDALGFGGGRAHGFKLYSQQRFNRGDIAFCYPREPTARPPTISGMFYSYLLLAKLFRESLISKSGDTSECRGYHLNLMYYCNPEHRRRIDGCDLIYSELRRCVRDRMTPNYAQYIQLLINKVVPAPLNTHGQRVKMEAFKVPAQGDRPDVPDMTPPERRSKESHDPTSSRFTRRPQHGISRFFSSMWQMCKNSNDVAHQSLAMTQETRRRQNEYMATRNITFPPPGPELEPVHAPNWEMPPLTDQMFQNFDPTWYGFGGPPPQPARVPTDDEDEEDEDAPASRDDGESSYSAGHEIF
ncbi:hypothetical protein QYE76_047451 [Lolium multiflorum]|uniref:Integrase catalytic domain-containing protein n=1 Tax=Lolium multiflorum TaxID=4521 RepID=A0AAD8TRW8_LOLMU|nr:hypothetical protein QYE76_047451 [Lolium multiflorum]